MGITLHIFKNVHAEVNQIIDECSMQGRNVALGRLLSLCQDDDDLIWALKQADSEGVLADHIREQYKDWLN